MNPKTQKENIQAIQETNFTISLEYTLVMYVEIKTEFGGFQIYTPDLWLVLCMTSIICCEAVGRLIGHILCILCKSGLESLRCYSHYVLNG